jgi:hypothetical protein
VADLVQQAVIANDTMKQFRLILIMTFLVFHFISGCNYKKENACTKIYKHELTQADSIWIAFIKAIEDKNISYLKTNSFDNIQCVDCVFDSINQTNYFPSEFIFQNYLDRLIHLDLLTDHKYFVSQNDTTIEIIYNIESKYAEEGREGIIYIFQKKDNKFLFEGMITMP